IALTKNADRLAQVVAQEADLAKALDGASEKERDLDSKSTTLERMARNLKKKEDLVSRGETAVETRGRDVDAIGKRLAQERSAADRIRVALDKANETLVAQKKEHAAETRKLESQAKGLEHREAGLARELKRLEEADRELAQRQAAFARADESLKAGRSELGNGLARLAEDRKLLKEESRSQAEARRVLKHDRE